MKYFYSLLIICTLAGCKKVAHIEFTGKTPGVKSGVFIVKNQRDSTIYGENIKDEKFYVNKILPEAGFYNMEIADDANKKTGTEPFEVYLEGGKVTVETEQGNIEKYPKITSASEIQQELSFYYSLVNKLGSQAHQQAENADNELNKKGEHLSLKAFNALVTKLSSAQEEQYQTKFTALKQFVKQYPKSTITAHLMNKLDYEHDPVGYDAVFKTFSAEAKNSDEGKEISEKLSRLVRLVPGAVAPAIVGNTPDGKPFDASVLKDKKVILVDFWRAVNQVSRMNHQEMSNILLSEMKNKNDLGIVSISIDTKSDWWTTAIREDKMNWPQVSDLKGDDSKNAENWAISTIPTYYLVDSQWHIIERDIDLKGVPLAVRTYLNKHH